MPDTAGWLIAAVLLTGIGVGLVVWSAHRRQRQADQGAMEALRSERDTSAALASAVREQLALERQALSDARAEVQRLSLANQQLETQLTERERSLREQLSQFETSKAALKVEFESLSEKILTGRDEQLRVSNQQSISAIIKPLEKQIEHFQNNANRVHGEFLKNTASLEAQIKALESVGLAMSAEANTLSRALKGDKKLVGSWGETQLERTLELAGLRPGEHYDTQAAFKDDTGKRAIPDFVLRLPDGKNMVIDSKVSLIDYERAVGADNDFERDSALLAHTQAVKSHIDDLSAKDYANLPGMSSPDFVLMFMPVEPAYIEAMRQSRELFNYGYQKNVVMVSHTTLMPILRTVANLWMIERSNAEAQELSARAGEVFNAVCVVAERLEAVGGSLQAAGNHYNKAVTALVGRQGLYNKVERFQNVSAKANKRLSGSLTPIDSRNDANRVGVLLDEIDKHPSSEEPNPVSGTDSTP